MIDINNQNDMNTKSAFISLVGRPNVGKSSLLNKLVGEKVSIVSNKPQTTRNRIMGIYTKDNTQLVFIDTPGAHKPKNRLGDFMERTIKDVISGVDVCVLLVTMSKRQAEQAEAGKDIFVPKEDMELINQLKNGKIPTILAINKIDLIKNKGLLLNFINRFEEEYDFKAIIPISALKGDGIDNLAIELEKFAFEGPFFFDKDTVTDQPEIVIASEIIREKMLFNLQEEVPHGIAVVVDYFGEREGKDVTILDVEANIFCEKENHKGIIIGKKGNMLKKIATEARKDMEDIFDVKVNLQLWVKVKEDWRNRQGLMSRFGFQK